MRSKGITLRAASATRANTWRSSMVSPMVRATAASASKALPLETSWGEPDMPGSLAENPTRGTPIAIKSAPPSGLLLIVLESDLLQPRMDPARQHVQERRGHLEQSPDLPGGELESRFAQLAERLRGIASEPRPQRLVRGELSDHDLYVLLAHDHGQRKPRATTLLVAGAALSRVARPGIVPGASRRDAH